MITGAILIGQQDVPGTELFQAIDPSTGAILEPGFASAGSRDVEQACALAEAASDRFAMVSPEERAGFLEAIADAIAGIGDALIVRAMQETGLPRARLEGERGRTIGQLRLFAQVLRQGDWLDATIDPALPDRQPLPRPDIRRMNVALGPVAVFGASNFPLAFSVAGGDTASALAAGCPVVVKGHPAHPGTGELVARAVQQAVKACGLPEGVFSYLPGPSIELGGALVADPRIKAVGFTGSRGGGLALVKTAAERAEPIPVYAEMSSINPVILLPGALDASAEQLGSAFVQSLTMGAGQFCTNPGVLIGIAGEALDRFAAAAAEALSASQPATMLTPGIHASFERGVDALERHSTVEVVARGCVGDGINQARGALFRAEAEGFLADTTLAHEVFGSSAILIRCRDLDEVQRVIASLEGQLTITVMMAEADQPHVAGMLPLLSRKAGRILANGWPTGVEVGHAMVHGGPYPATSDGRTTSVGSLAIARFLRPVCFQQLPDAVLPAALKSANPWGLQRRVDGVRQA
ncbi:MAG TPA: aldehyde dehydrogenase (NADP(+)) [Sphingomonas sp.]